MVGLLKYDVYSIKKPATTYLIILLAAAASILVLDNIYFMASFQAIVTLQIPIVLFQAREKSGANKMIRMLPLSSPQVVMEMYGVLGVFLLAAAVIEAAAFAGMYMKGSALTSGDIVGVYITLLVGGGLGCLIMALCIRFGPSQASAVFFGFIVGMMLIGFLIVRYADKLEKNIQPDGKTVAVVLAAGSVIVAVLSIIYSICTYKKKEF